MEETFKPMGHINHESNTGIVTPSKYEEGRLHKCACGDETTTNLCAWCRIVKEVGYDMSMLRESFM
jgi:hypothetical protein